MLALLLLSCRSPVPVPTDTAAGSDLLWPVGEGALRVDPGGWVDVVDADGRVVLQHAVGVAMLDAADDSGVELRTDDAELLSVEEEGEGEAWTVRMRSQTGDDAPELLWTLRSDGDAAVTASLAVDNTTEGEVVVAKLAPIRADARDGGALFLGADPARHRILENGSYAAVDFVVEVRPGDTQPDAAAAVIAPGEYEGHSVSNGNHAVVDLDGDAVWVAGALSFSRSLPVMNLTGDAAVGLVDDAGRQGFSYLSLEADLLPQPQPVAAGQTLESERYWLAPFEDDALLGLERYAQALADHLGVVPWQRRADGRRVPNGWNSWSGSGGTGGYGTDVDEELILDNLDWMATQLRDWGMDWFQLDDGYEPAYGDWTWNEERFPSGARGLSDAIRARGMTPGLWMAPFTADPDSALYAEHPDWFAEKSVLGMVVSGDDLILDLSKPEVQAWLEDVGRTVRDDWGYDWYKLDFGYYALLAAEYDSGGTREQAWAEGVQAVRRGLGDDAFLLTIGVLGPNYALADSMRTTLDNAPVWDWDPALSADDHLSQQGFKPTVRTAGRRWYLQDRVWINHPDLIFFRSNTVDTDWPAVTLEEARAFSTFVGLSGGIVKLGDRLVDLTGDQVDVIRRLLPSYGSAARPLDVFEREFPEVWNLPVHAPLDGYDEEYEVLGLFNWGWNLDLTMSPYGEIADDGAARDHRVDLDARGLDGTWLAWEFWTGEYLGEVNGALALSVPAHDCRVVALRRPLDHPQFLGWNRQLTMGGVLLEAVTWDASQRNLTVRAPVVPGTELAPFSWRLAFHLPEGFALSAVQADGVALDSLQWRVEGDVATVEFEPTTAGELELRLVF